MHRNTRLGYLVTIAAAVIWAATSPGIQYLLDTHHVPALAVAFWRDALIAIACLAGLLALRPALLRVSGRDLRELALAGSLSIGLYHALWVYSIVLNGAAVAVVMVYTFPTFVTLGAWLFYGERIRWPQVLALIVALLGCALLVRAYDPAVLRVSWLGTLVGLVTGISQAGYVLYNQRAMQTHSPWTSLTYTMLFGSLALLALWGLSAATGIFPIGPTANLLAAVGSAPAPWLVLLALALGPTLLGYALFTTALRYLPGSVASVVIMLEAPVSVLMTVVFLGARLEWPQTLGIGLILGASVLPRLRALEGNAPASQDAHYSSGQETA